MAKTDFRVIDISMKITNQLPMIRITEDLVVTVKDVYKRQVLYERNSRFKVVSKLLVKDIWNILLEEVD